MHERSCSRIEYVGASSRRVDPEGSARIVDPSLSDGQQPGEIRRSHAVEPSDHYLVTMYRAGDQDAATQLYCRYFKRLTSLVKRRCSAELARCAGVEDIVQSVFATFFRRAGQGYYVIPDGEVAWKVLLVIALNKVRSQATYYYADKRDARRTIIGPEAQVRLRLHGDTRELRPASSSWSCRKSSRDSPTGTRGWCDY